jgi:hypothetical protein
VEPEGSLSASERGLVGCLVLYSEDGFEDTVMRGLKKGGLSGHSLLAS